MWFQSQVLVEYFGNQIPDLADHKEDAMPNAQHKAHLLVLLESAPSVTIADGCL